MTAAHYIHQQLDIREQQVNAVLKLISEGATIPFVARYRKEATGGLDEVQIGAIREANEQFEQTTKRQQTILKAIEEQGQLTDELKKQIKTTFDQHVLEDLYLPYKKKRQTRAEKARKKGLEGLAKIIMAQNNQDVVRAAKRFVKGEVKTAEDALQGARYIIAEWVNEHAVLRAKIRNMYQQHGTLQSKVIGTKKEEASKYNDYFNFKQLLRKCPSYRFLAIHRAVDEGLLRAKVIVDEERVFDLCERFFVKGNNAAADEVRLAYTDAYKRLIHPSMENEALSEKKKEADVSAIKVFADNLRQLLLAPPLGKKRILAIDPGYRTGCKVVCIDESGDLLTNATIFPHAPQKETGRAKSKLFQLVQAHKIDAIAIGNGTASRETEYMIKRIHFDRDVNVFVVSEDGASIYSASKIGREEFPQYDVTVRGAVSIGRRLMDPLAELVKLDPKSIGVGQYQHEVNQQLLKDSLDEVVVSCVNQVGVNVNTASSYLLAYVSGLGSSLAKSIVDYRKENGPFKTRTALKKVPRLGEKAFEQCAGFLRIPDGKNMLDNSAVHPESYAVVRKMAKQAGEELSDFVGNKTLLDGLNKGNFPYVDDFLFNDLIKELKKPGRDPRKQIKVLEFDSTVKSIEDLSVGKTLNGIVTNVTDFGAFVNIGIKENGLIHKSNLADSYVEHPSDHIKLHEHVTVEVIQIDAARKRIGLKRV
ncbi:MAG: Tex family protein [Bacteroidota bacterium]